MIAEAVRRSPLADYAERFTTLYEATGGAVSIREQPFVTQINLRVDPRDELVTSRLTSHLGFGPPLTPNTVASGGDRRALWLGPDEWLIVGPLDQSAAIQQALRDGLDDASASIVDVSANRAVILVEGDRARALLSRGIAIDLDPRAFTPARCAQTWLAKSQVIIERRGRDDAFQIYVRCSYARYLADWLLDAADSLE